MLPPSETDVSAADLWTQITASPRAHRIVPFPRTAGGACVEVAMVVLEQQDAMAAKASSARWVQKMLREKGAAGDAFPEDRQALAEMRDAQELLFRACRRAGDLGRPFFPTLEAIGKLTTDEVSVLVMHYQRVQVELGPIVAEMSTEEIDAWIERLAKGGSLFPFDGLSSGAQSLLIMSMAARLWSFMTASSSPGQPPGERT
jgi:alkylation response protein AidB-like acyl-CoA dehydrogenase